MTVGLPTEKSTVVGPVISGAQRDRIEGYVERGEQQGVTTCGTGG